MIKLRPYQKEAVDAIYRKKRGIIVVPAGGGKTIIGASAIRKAATESHREEKPNVIWIANTVEQCHQAKEACEKCAVFDAANVIIKCAAGIKSVKGADLVLFDECHHLGSETWMSIAFEARELGIAIWGMTATPEREDGQDIADIIAGRIVYRVGRDVLLGIGSLVPAMVYIQDISGDITSEVERLASQEFKKWHSDEQRNRIRYRHAVDLGIVNYKDRNELISRKAKIHCSSGDSGLILVSRIEHAEIIQSIVHDSEICTSKLSKKKRADMIDRLKNRDLQVMIATSLADEGLDVPCIDFLIMACGGRASGKSEQRTGRVLRASDGKTQGVIYDFMDNHFGMLRGQSYARLRTYKKLNYKITKEC